MANYGSDVRLTIHGVPGRLTHRTTKPGQADGLWFRQRWISEARPCLSWGDHHFIRAEIRFDDDPSNGHNTFAVTADIFERRSNGRTVEAGCGCNHNEIAAAFPELAHLIRWHLTSSDGPLHYIANAIYFASDRDCRGKRAGEVLTSETMLRFGDVPMLHKVPRRLREFLLNISDDAPDAKAYSLTPISVSHRDRPGETYKFAPKWQFAGMPALAWHECPFDDEGEAERFAASFLAHAPEWVTVPTSFSEGKARDLDAARSAAVWPEATDAELSGDPAELRAKLEARAPALIEAFRRDVLAAGFLWSPADYRGDATTA